MDARPKRAGLDHYDIDPLGQTGGLLLDYREEYSAPVFECIASVPAAETTPYESPKIPVLRSSPLEPISTTIRQVAPFDQQNLVFMDLSRNKDGFITEAVFGEIRGLRFIMTTPPWGCDLDAFIDRTYRGKIFVATRKIGETFASPLIALHCGNHSLSEVITDCQIHRSGGKCPKIRVKYMLQLFAATKIAGSTINFAMVAEGYSTSDVAAVGVSSSNTCSAKKLECNMPRVHPIVVSFDQLLAFDTSLLVFVDVELDDRDLCTELAVGEINGTRNAIISNSTSMTPFKWHFSLEHLVTEKFRGKVFVATGLKKAFRLALVKSLMPLLALDYDPTEPFSGPIDCRLHPATATAHCPEYRLRQIMREMKERHRPVSVTEQIV